MLTETGLGLERRLSAIRNLGLTSSAVYAWQKVRQKVYPPAAPYLLTSRDSLYGLRCRPNTSDVDVFAQIFVGREYRCLDDVRDVDFIVDCGANVGYSSAFFLSRHPHARAVAIEPDPENFAMLEANLRPFAGRYEAHLTAVWSKVADLAISEEVFGDGRQWSRTVRVARPGDAHTMKAIDIGTIAKNAGAKRISILKIDVEGAEVEIFSDNARDWLDKVDNLVIELHGPEAEKIVKRAVAEHDFETSTCDELFVCKRRNQARERAR